MWKIPVICALLATFAGAQTPGDDRSAEHWASMCRTVSEASPKAGGSLKIPATFEAGQCWGTFEALSVMSSLEDHGKPLLRICPPNTLSTYQWISIFVEYTKNHPDQKRDPFAFVAIAGLQEAFPCK